MNAQRPMPARPAGPPPQEPSQAIDLKDLFFRMRRYSWLLVLPIVACLCVAMVYTRHVQPVYQAYLVVAVEEPSDVSAGLRPYVQGENPGTAPRERIALVDARIHNHAFLRAVAERMGMDKDPRLLARATAATKALAGITPGDYALRLAVGTLWGKVSVGQGRGTAIQITVKDASPEYARDLAAVIGDALQQQSLQATLERAQARGEMSKDQIAVYEERVRQKENALLSFQQSHQRMSFNTSISSEQDLQSAQGLQRSAEEEVAQLQLRIRAGQDEWRALAGDEPLPTLSSGRANELSAQLNRLEQAAASAALTPRAANVADAQGRVTAMRGALAVEFDRIAGSLSGNFTAEARMTASGVALDRAVLRSIQARADQFGSAIRSYVSNVQRSPGDQLELQKLQDELTAARNILAKFRDEATSSRISEALATSQVGPRLEILEHPLLPLQPSSLGPQATYALAIFIGLIIDAAIVFSGERLAAVIRTVEQAEAEYGLRVVGVVPRILHRPKPGGYIKNHWPQFAIVAVLLVTVLVVVVEITVFPQPTKTGQVQQR